MTTLPCSDSHTVSQLTVRSSSGNGLCAFRIGVATATASSPAGTRKILTRRHVRGSASTASRPDERDGSARNAPLS